MCVLHLLCKVNPDVPVDAKGRLKTEKPWPTAQTLMKEPKKFLESLNSYKEAIDTDKVPPNNFKAIRDIIAQETFTPENMASKSSAAAGVCDWIKNIT
jgi:dynein heavy chain